MNSLVDTFSFLCFWIHSFYFGNFNFVSIFIRVLLSFHQCHDAFFLIRYILDEAFNCLFTIFIQHFEFLAEIIEYVSVGSFSFYGNKFDAILSTIVVQQNNLAIIMHCSDYNLILF